MSKDEELTRLVFERKRLNDELDIIKTIRCSEIVGFAYKPTNNIYGKQLPSIAVNLIKDCYNAVITDYDNQIINISIHINNLLNP